MRKRKIEIIQLWRCASCKRVFTPAPAAPRNKTYPLHVVLDAITLYNLGYMLAANVEKMRSRFGARIGLSTIAGWLADHPRGFPVAVRTGFPTVRQRSALVHPASISRSCLAVIRREPNARAD